jgi:hypothetical protein
MLAHSQRNLNAVQRLVFSLTVTRRMPARSVSLGSCLGKMSGHCIMLPTGIVRGRQFNRVIVIRYGGFAVGDYLFQTNYDKRLIFQVTMCSYFNIDAFSFRFVVALTASAI